MEKGICVNWCTFFRVWNIWLPSQMICFNFAIIHLVWKFWRRKHRDSDLRLRSLRKIPLGRRKCKIVKLEGPGLSGMEGMLDLVPEDAGSCLSCADSTPETKNFNTVFSVLTRFTWNHVMWLYFVKCKFTKANSRHFLVTTQLPISRNNINKPFMKI